MAYKRDKIGHTPDIAHIKKSYPLNKKAFVLLAHW